MWVVEVWDGRDWQGVEECEDFGLALELVDEYRAEGREARPTAAKRPAPEAVEPPRLGEVEDLLKQVQHLLCTLASEPGVRELCTDYGVDYGVMVGVDDEVMNTPVAAHLPCGVGTCSAGEARPHACEDRPMPTYYKFSPETTAGWKSYPVRVHGPRPSTCHQAPTLLVQSMSRGFVSANCSECGGKDLLKQNDFLNLDIWVGCPQCKGAMDATLLSEIRGTTRLAGNYGYVCATCQIYILLADLLPHWQDVRG